MIPAGKRHEVQHLTQEVKNQQQIVHKYIIIGIVYVLFRSVECIIVANRADANLLYVHKGKNIF